MVATTFNEAQYTACGTKKLTRDMDDEQAGDWNNYLIDYTHALAGCEVPPASFGGRGFLPGGIARFGPANLAAIGLPQPQLGRDDSELLITQFLDAFAVPLRLTDVERAAVAAFLRSSAESQINDLLSGTLSTCAEEAPNGG